MTYTKFKPAVVMIDLDGTLIDSVPDLAYCVDVTMEHLGIPSRGEAAVRNWVGNGIEKLLHRALCNSAEGTADSAMFTRAKAIFWQAYQRDFATRSALYPGVVEGLTWLKEQGYKVACVTNKAATFTLPILKAKQLSSYFDIVVSGDTCVYKKPHKQPLVFAAQQLGVAVSDGLMIGDSKTDIGAARAAGCQVFALPYGYNHGEAVATADPDVILDSLAQLPEYLLPG